MKRSYLFSLMLIVVGGLLGNGFRFLEKQPDRLADFDLIPLQVEGYMGESMQLGADVEDILKATSSTMRNYHSPDGVDCDLFVGYFRSQKFGSSIHSPKHCLPGSGWKIRVNYPYELKIDQNSVKEVNRLIISYRNQEAVMIYWFETRDGSVRSEYGLKFDLFRNALMMRPTDAAFVRITVPVEGQNYDQATARAVKFIRTLYPSLQKALPF